MDQMRNITDPFKEDNWTEATNPVMKPNHSQHENGNDMPTFLAASQNDENLNIANTLPRVTGGSSQSQPAEQAVQEESMASKNDQLILKGSIARYKSIEHRYIARSLESPNRGSYFRLRHRNVAVDHFSKLHMEFGLRFPTLLLSVSLFDRYTTMVTIHNGNELALAIQAIAFLAMKIEEIYPPRTVDVFDSDDPADLKSIFKEERRIINAFKGRFEKVSPYGYLAYLHSTKNMSNEESMQAQYLLEIYLRDYSLSGQPFSLIALAVDFLIHLFRGNQGQWKNMLELHSKEKVKEIATQLHSLAVNCRNMNYPLYLKYSSNDYERVSTSIYFARIQ